LMLRLTAAFVVAAALSLTHGAVDSFALTETIYPSGTGTGGAVWTFVGAPGDALDTDADGDTGSAYSTANGAIQRMAMDDPLFVSGSVNSVTIHMVAKGAATNLEAINFGFSDGVNGTLNGAVTMTGAYANYQFTSTERPGGGAWTPADVVDSQAHLQVQRIGTGLTGEVRATQVYMVVDYTPAVTTLDVSSSAFRPLVGTLLAPSTTGALVDGFVLRRSAGTDSISVSSVTISNSGPSPATDIESVSIYADDGDLVFDAGLDAPVGSAQVVGASTTVPVVGVTVGGVASHFWVVYDIDSTAVNTDVVNSLVSAVVSGATATNNSATTGPDFAIDAAGPTTFISSPLSGVRLAGTSHTIAGTASDGTGVGVSSVELMIERVKGVGTEYWDGSAWTSSATWFSAGNLSWSYVWTLPVDDGSWTYEVSARATDGFGQTGGSSSVAGVTVGTVPSTVVSAAAVDATHVDVVFSDPLDSSTVSGFPERFVLSPPLAVTSASVDGGDPRIVHLVTGSQIAGLPYTVTVSSSVLDAQGNAIAAPNDSAGFLGHSAGSGFSLSSSPARPGGRRVAPSTTGVAVDGFVMRRLSGTDVTVSSITINNGGAAPATNVSRVGLYLDEGNGSFGAEDGEAFGVGTFSGANVTIPLGSVSVDDTADTFWVVYDIAGGATNGAVVNSLVVSVVHDAATLDYSATRGQDFTIDAQGPALSPVVVVVDADTVRMSFDEEIVDVQPTDFTITDGLAVPLPVIAASLLPGGTVVELTTAPHVANEQYTVTLLAGGVSDIVGNVCTQQTADFIASPAADSEPPTTPQGVSAAPGASFPFVAIVSWGASMDNVGVKEYVIKRSTAAGGPYVEVGRTAGVDFADPSGTSGIDYYYTVVAVDDAGNESLDSDPAGPVKATWTVTTHQPFSLDTRQCAWCHAPHTASPEQGVVLKYVGSGTRETDVCYECHDGSPATDIKSGSEDSFALSSGHSLESTPSSGDLTKQCSSCHAQHRDAVSAPSLYPGSINGHAVTGENRTWCMACHDDDNNWYDGTYSGLSSPVRDAAGYPVLGTYPGRTYYDSSGRNAHVAIATATPVYPAGDCRYCHASHRGVNAYDGLVDTFRPSSFGSVANDRVNGTYASLCFGCHDGTAEWSAEGATDIKRFATRNGADDSVNSGHRIKTPGGTLPVNAPLPCYDCHQPHGSDNSAMLTPELGVGMDTTTAEGVRRFCFTCHSTSDTVKGWSTAGAGSFVAVAGRSVEGLPRDGALLRLPPVDGHGETDTSSCYACHGEDYSTPDSNNVHNPGPGASAGGVSCFSCHTYQSMQSSGTYHHYLTSDDAAPYPIIADPSGLLTDDDRRTCLMCHVDHDFFDPSLNVDPAHSRGRAQNLRASVYAEPTATDASTYVNYDFSEGDAGDGGVCVSCHKVRMTKNTSNRASDTDETTQTPPIRRPDYNLSAHNYFATAQSIYEEADSTTFTTDMSGFYANCAKCHNDTMAKAYQTGPNKFGTHSSANRSVLTDGGQDAAMGTDPQESNCYLCHSRAFEPAPSNPKGGAGYAGSASDFYGSGLMMGVMAEDALNVKGTFNLGGSRHPVEGDGISSSRVECVNCHNVHKAEFSLGFFPESGVVQDPDNTLAGSALNGDHVYIDGPATGADFDMNSDYCLRCHDGTTPVKANDGVAYVPYDVFIVPSKTAQSNKSTYRSKSHFNNLASQTASTAVTIELACANCHDKHASSLPKLLGVVGLPGSDPTINGSALSANDNGVCYACHMTVSADFPAGEEQRRSADGYLMTGTWPGLSTYAGATGIHKAILGGVAGTSLPGYSAGDCKTCHDVHGTAQPFDQLRLGFSAQEYVLCFDCHDDGPSSADIKASYPVFAGGSSTGERAGHRVLSDTSAAPGATLSQGDAMPCYNCHNPHGSASPDGLQVRDVGDEAGDAFNMSSGAGVRQFCFSCHLTSDSGSHLGWNGSAYAAVAVGVDDTVEGITRDSASYKLLLPDFAEHRQANNSSCLGCHMEVHEPVVQDSAPTGGLPCYDCHTAFKETMDADGQSRTDYYHHVVGTGGNTYSGQTPFLPGAYPAAGTDVYCLSCHVDHDKFAPSRAGNLRQDSSADPLPAATDFPAAGGFGVCVSCHDVSREKDTGNQATDGFSSAVPAISGAEYRDSAHDYAAQSTFNADSTQFSANCSKCHDDEQSQGTFQSTPGNVFRTHFSAEQRLLALLGASPVDPMSELHCFGCHRGDVDGTDFYDTKAMSQGARRTLTQFGQASRHPVDGDGVATARVECVNCHNSHEVSASSPVSDPDNTYDVAAFSNAAEKTAFCLKCHDASAPSYAVNGATYVPASVVVKSSSANKSTYSGGGHWSSARASSSIDSGEEVACGECHDNHGSNAPKLLGVFDPVSGTNRIGSVTLTANNNDVCSACHTNAQSSFPYTESDRETGTGYLMDGTWPGFAVFTGSGGIHKTAVGGGAGSSLPGYAAGDCKTCHDVHGTAQAYDGLRLGYADQDYALCFDCHDGGPAGTDIRALYPVAAGGTSTDERAGHRVLTDTTSLSGARLSANDAVPCYDCHNPHGSASPSGLQVRDIGATPADAFDLSDGPGVREFCFACHVTSDTQRGWNGTAYTAVVAGVDDTVEGITRTSTSYRLRLPVLDPHVETNAEDCNGCHGNVHEPGGGSSSGGVNCLNCHGAASAERLDKMIDDTTSYHHVLDDADPGKAPGTGAYPSSTGTLSCVSCHTDHNYFNSDKGSNLRTGIGNPGGSTSNSDFSTAAPYGVCISCHNASLGKNTLDQKSSSNTPGADASANTPRITGPEYTASAHNYSLATQLGSGGSPFNANCIKCHNDDQVKKYQPNSVTPFALHYSSTQRLLATLGYSGAEFADPLGDIFCYKCHKSNDSAYAGNPNATDYYAVQPMTARARAAADGQFARRVLAIINGATTVRSYDVATNTWGTLTGTPATAPGAGSNLVFHGGNFAYFPGAAVTFQIMDPLGTADANKTPATPRWAASASAHSPALPVAANLGAALASDGMYLYYLQGNNTAKTYRLDTGTMAAGNLQGKAWVDATAGATRGMADVPETVGDGGSIEWAGGDYLYATVGKTGVKTYQYRISTDTWSDANAADLPLPTASSADLCWTGGSYIYAIRGAGTNSVYRGTIDANGAIVGWISVAAPPANFGAGAELTWDGGKYIYAFQGGSTAFWRYNTVTNTWTPMAVAPATVGANTNLVAWLPAGHDERSPGKHRVDEEAVASEGWMPSTQRHVQCADCHNVHQAKSGTHAVATTNIATKDLGGANEGVWGTEYAPPIYVAGTATFTKDSTTVTGSGTAWTAANGVYPGSWIQSNADKHYYQIAAVNSATQVTLATTYKGTTANATAYTLRLGYNVGTSATFTKGSKTITGSGTSWSTTVIPVGSYIRSNSIGGWYRVVSVDSATQLTVNDEYRGATYAGGYNVIRVAYAKVASGSVTRQYQICLKCHTGYAWGTGAPPTGQSSGPWGRAWKQTDVAVDFDPVNYAYHPLFQRGRNQPSATANANWTGAGRKAATYDGGNANPSTGLDNTFVDGWGTQSLVECTDCHDHPTPASGPVGPHGSSYRWLMKGLDPNITVTLAGNVVRYPNRAGGTAGGTPYSATATCANCHRGDVYRVSASQYLGTTYGAYSRFNHFGVNDGNCVPSLPQDGDSAATYWPNGCMNCHGGDTPGSLHGTSRGVGSTVGTSEMGKRFMNGSSWVSHTLGDTDQAITCYTIGTANDVSSCTQHGGGRAATAVYPYTWE
jgi:predicted CXXCH cytochrome family protein